MARMSKRMTNQEIAELFRLMAAAHEVKGENYFVVRAYQNAAATIEHATSDLRDLWQEGKLRSLSGIGGNIASYLDELFRTGKVKHFETELKGLPAGMEALLTVAGIGPKSAIKLAREFKLTQGGKVALEKLKQAAIKGKIAALPGFGVEKEKRIIEAIEEKLRRKSARGRLLLPEAERLAGELVEYLKKDQAVLEVEVLGSLRRRVATVGDVDLAVKTNKPEEVMTHLKRYPGILKVLSSGPKTTMFVHKSGRQMDVKVSPPSQWGAMLQHYTGGKNHNIRLRTYALKKGMSLSEAGIRHKEKLYEFQSEKEFYNYLGMDYIPVELREDVGEVDLARKKALPSLVTLADIKGDLHMHCNIMRNTSHDAGASSLRELLDQANELNYEYIGISDHNPKSALSETEMLSEIKRRNELIDKQSYAYEKRVKKKIKVFKGLEVDIKANGDLAVSDRVLNELDYAIVSVHAAFGQSREEATKRVLRAFEHPKVRIFGHPAGRKLLKREGLDYDWRKIFETAKKKGIFLEINAAPDRLDLSDTLVRVAVELGVKLIIDTDSHALTEMELMKYGVDVARRGWAKKQDIVNTLSVSRIERLLT